MSVTLNEFTMNYKLALISATIISLLFVILFYLMGTPIEFNLILMLYFLAFAFVVVFAFGEKFVIVTIFGITKDDTGKYTMSFVQTMFFALFVVVELILLLPVLMILMYIVNFYFRL